MKPVCGGFHAEGKERKFVGKKIVSNLLTDPSYMRHWVQGPSRVTRLGDPVFKTTVDGIDVPVEWEYRIHLAGFPSWRTRQEVVKRFNLSAHNSRGWSRARVWTRFVGPNENPHCTLYIVGDADTNCGPGTSCVRSRNGVATMHMRDSHLFNILHFVTNHELGHAIFAACDMYKYDDVEPSGYRGVMDNGLDKTNWPTPQDIEAASFWLEGDAPYTGC